MAHLKRLVAPKTWPIKRKETVFVTRQYPRAKQQYSMPLSIILRDLLNVAGTTAEAKRILREKNILVNGIIRTDKKFAATLFDVIQIPTIKKNYVLTLNKLGKLSLTEIEKPSYRLLRIEGKTKIAGGKLQLNLFDGTNVLANSSSDFNIGEVVKLSMPGNKLSGKLSRSEGAKVLVIGGAHIGETAFIKSFGAGKNSKEVLLKGESSDFLTRLGNVYLIE